MRTLESSLVKKYVRTNALLDGDAQKCEVAIVLYRD
jgi:hypothetical protein